MDRWNGKVAVVTGAASGIGLATAKALVHHGLIVVGFARRKEQMENNMKDVKGPGKFYAKKCDITNEEEVIESLNWVKNNFGSLNILINNAGHSSSKRIEDTPTSELEHIFKVNVFGLLYCSKHAVKLMKDNQKEAHIVNINSDLGHKVPKDFSVNVYPASKFAVRALSETFKNELEDSKIRVTNLSPGLVKTEMSDKAAEEYPIILKLQALKAEDVAASIIHVLAAPPHVQITELQIEPKQCHA